MENRPKYPEYNSTPSNSSSSDPQTPPLEIPEPNASNGNGFKETWLKLDQVKELSTGIKEIEIESLIVERLVDRHTSWIDSGKKA